MEYDYLVLARSITQAQRMARALAEAGMHCRWFRAPTAISAQGCAYVVRVTAQQIQPAVVCLEEAGFPPQHIYRQEEDGYKEVFL